MSRFLLAIICFATIPAALPQAGDTISKAEVEALRNEVKALREDVERLKAAQREAASRQNPIFDVTSAPSMGDPKAQVVLIEFSDFQCPYCMDYFTNTYRKVIDSYVKTGKIRYVVRDFPNESIHPNALKAAEAANCATEQGKFWGMHDALFNNQKLLGSTGITDAARSSGLNMTAFQTCLDSGKYVEKIRKDTQDTAKLGANGTPVFFIGTTEAGEPMKVKLMNALVGSQPLPKYQAFIDSLLQRDSLSGRQ
jgi:protein-disulfide isomerase